VIINNFSKNFLGTKAPLSVIAVLSVIALGCGKDASSDQLTVADQALDKNLATCQNTSQECLRSFGSFNGIQACQTSFTTCLKEAVGQVEETQKSVDQCRKDARTCASAAKGLTETDACGTKLNECLAKLNPVSNNPGIRRADAGPIFPEIPGLGDLPGIGRDGGLPTIPGLGDLPGIKRDGGLPTIPGLGDLPESNCIQKMGECVRAGEKDPATCAGEVQTCIQNSIPDSGKPTTSSTDGGVKASGSDCRQALSECLRADQDPTVCADDARACLRQPVQPPTRRP
jgi:hypothetical protein